MTEPSAGERRRSKRLLYPIPCVAQPGPEAKPGRAVIGNISLHGAFLHTPFQTAAGSALTLSFTLGGEHFEDVPAAVVWARPAPSGWECGVKFPEAWSGRVQQALLHPQDQSILMVEDDAAVRAAMERHLASAGYLVSAAGGIEQGARMFQERNFDLVVVDLNLPDGNGMTLVEKVRAHPKRFATPVVILTADSRTESKLAGLAFGADHYLTKPIDPMEFLFSVSALLRRTRYNQAASGILKFERGEIDPAAHLVRLGDKEISNLSRKEFDLLYHLIASRPKVLSKRYILSKLWHTVATDNTVEVHVGRLRDKLGPEGAFRIVTVSGKGYKFV